MSYFSAVVESVMREQNLTQKELSRRAQVHQGQLSRYINAEARPDSNGLERLCQALGPDGSKVLVAFLKDEIPYNLRNTVSVVAQTGPLAVADTPPQPVGWDRLTPSHQELLNQIIAEADCSPSLMRVLASVLELARER